MLREHTARAVHLVRRFAQSLRPRPLDADDRALVARVLTPAERACWDRLGAADRAESVATARAFGVHEDDRWLAAALLHDVGKSETGFGPLRRSVATAIATVVGVARMRTWTNGLGRYVNHDALGGERLRAAGARPEAAAWAAAHHRPDLWSAAGIAPEICAQLARADGEPSLE